MLPLLLSFTLALHLQAASTGPVDPAKGLRSSDADVRLAAVRALAADGAADAEKLLIKALDDDDWEVVMVACAELGELGAKKAFGPLLDLALTGRVRGVRRTAAEALARIDGETAWEKLAKKLDGDEALPALQAVAEVAPAVDGRTKTAALEALLEERQANLREAAARALVLLAGKQRPARVAGFLEGSDVAVAAAALEAGARSGDAALVPVLLERLGAESLDPVLERRLDAALRAIALLHPDGRDALVAGLARGSEGAAAARPRHARALGLLAAERDGVRALPATVAAEALERFLGDGEAATRAAAVAALERVGGDAAFERAAGLAAGDADARVRKVALGVVTRARDAKDGKTRALCEALLAKDPDALVREDAAVALGLRGLGEARAALEAALADRDWGVVTCAAVSLGKTQASEAVPALTALYERGAGDWRARASAVTGLAHLRATDGIEVLLRALDDEEPLVARTAYEVLAAIAQQRLPPTRAAWTKWWAENGGKVVLTVPDDVLEKRKKYGYGEEAADPRQVYSRIYSGLDVLVLQTQAGGDSIQAVLDGLGITHRLTTSGQVVEDGPHPSAVFVANCPGEITDEEAQRLGWFVRAGGALFASCWALDETVVKIRPGFVRKLKTRGEVVGEVPGFACSESEFLEGVFPPDVVPVYHLEGAQLVDVLDPEQVEVLVDSPRCARAFGGGNLAAWFRMGHGVVLDSANHFEEQGFSSAAAMSDPIDRQAWAVDHMGLSLAALRANRKASFWGKTSTAAEEIKDLSVFRLITNFVRARRIAE